MTRPARLDDATIANWIEHHRSWRLEEGHLVRELSTRDYPGSISIVQAQTAIAEELDHHPIITVGYRELRFELWTHDREGITRLDLDYCERLDEMLAERFSRELQV